MYLLYIFTVLGAVLLVVFGHALCKVLGYEVVFLIRSVKSSKKVLPKEATIRDYCIETEVDFQGLALQIVFVLVDWMTSVCRQKETSRN